MKIANLFSDATHYTKGALARDGQGFECDPEDDQARSWCLLGAISHCYKTAVEREVARKKILQLLQKKYRLNDIVDFNDGWTSKASDVRTLAEEAHV